MQPFSDLWLRLAKVDTRWRMLVEAVQRAEDSEGGRRWSVTLSPREAAGARGGEAGTGRELRVLGDTLLEALARAVEAAETEDAARGLPRAAV